MRPEERRVTRERHRVASSEVLGVGARCIAYLATWGPWTLPPSWLDADTAEWLASAQTFHRELTWPDAELDAIVRSIAQDRLNGRLAVLSRATHAVYLPYDGGADLLFPHERAAARARERFAAWLG